MQNEVPQGLETAEIIVGSGVSFARISLDRLGIVSSFLTKALGLETPVGTNQVACPMMPEGSQIIKARDPRSLADDSH